MLVKDFEQPAPVPRKIDETKDDVDNDYVNSRDNYYNLIDKGNEAIEGILDIAKEGQHPRAYEVAGQLISQVAQTVDKLQDLQKKLKDLKEVPNKTSANIKNALFVGSTNELQQMLNRKNEDEIIEGKMTNPKKIILDISKMQFIKSMTPLPELLDGEELINPIEVLKHEVSLTSRKGVNGVEYTEKEYSVWRGSQRVQAARQLGYTHIEGIVINV